MGWRDVTLRLCVCHQSVIGSPDSVFRLFRRPEQQLLGDSIMRALCTLLSSAAAGAALLANVNASADTPVAITYVQNSLTEAKIAAGPWTLHQMVGRNRHDASGIVPDISTPYNPPTTAMARLTRIIEACAAGCRPLRALIRCSPTTFRSCARTMSTSKASSTTGRATSRKRPSRRSHSIGARAGFSPTRHWG